MKRIVLVLAFLALGGGCYDSSYDDAPGTLTFYWQFQGATGRTVGTFDVDPATTPLPDSSCYADGVPWVDTIQITADGLTEQPITCTGPNQVPGARLGGFVPGVHSWRIDAFRGNQLVFTQSGTSTTGSSGDTQQLVTLQAVTPQEIVVYYDVNNQPPTNCLVNSTPITHVAYEIRDAADRIADSSCVSRDPPVVGECTAEGTSACDPASLGFVTRTPLPLGNYLMNYLELWQTTAQNTPQPIAQICATDQGASFVHEGFPVFMNLGVSSGQFCPSNSPAAALIASGPVAP